MKPTLVILTTSVALIGCSNNQPASHANAAARTEQVDENDKPPKIGMTKAQVVARYGEPRTKTVTDEGERWTYVLNMGQFIGKHMIPFFFSTQELRTGAVIFGPDGRVKKYYWDVPHEQG